MGRKLTFEWDDHNTNHLARHGVSREEFEDAFARPMVEQINRVKDEYRVAAYAMTSAGRYLFVAYTMRNNNVRPVTAYTLPRKLRRIYNAAKESL